MFDELCNKTTALSKAYAALFDFSAGKRLFYNDGCLQARGKMGEVVCVYFITTGWYYF